MAARPARLPSPTALLHSARALCGTWSRSIVHAVHAPRQQSPRHACSSAQLRPQAAAAAGGGGGAPDSVLFISPVRSGQRCLARCTLLHQANRGGCQQQTPISQGRFGGLTIARLQLPRLRPPAQPCIPCPPPRPPPPICRSGRSGPPLPPGCAPATCSPPSRSAAGRRPLPAPPRQTTTRRRSRRRGWPRTSARPTARPRWKASWRRRGRRPLCSTASMLRRPSGAARGVGGRLRTCGPGQRRAARLCCGLGACCCRGSAPLLIGPCDRVSLPPAAPGAQLPGAGAGARCAARPGHAGLPCPESCTAAGGRGGRAAGPGAGRLARCRVARVPAGAGRHP